MADLYSINRVIKCVYIFILFVKKMLFFIIYILSLVTVTVEDRQSYTTIMLHILKIKTVICLIKKNICLCTSL